MPIKDLNDKLFEGSHDTALIGWDGAGNLVFLKGYNYGSQKNEAQADLKRLDDAGLTWRIGHVTNLKLQEPAGEIQEVETQLPKHL